MMIYSKKTLEMYDGVIFSIFVFNNDKKILPISRIFVFIYTKIRHLLMLDFHRRRCRY